MRTEPPASRMSGERVSVIIPTLATRDRKVLLERSIASVLSQDHVAATPIVVVNGDRCDSALVTWLEQDSRLQVLRQRPADLPSALRLGVTRVATPWFTSLDDDDEMLPGALWKRVNALQRDPGFDAVVTNGYQAGADGASLNVPDMAAVGRDPLVALATSNWLLPGAWLCRSDPASRALFDGMPRYLECTYLAIRLCTLRRVRFIDEPTVVWHTDSPDSLSKSRAYRLGQADALSRILELELPAGLRRCLMRRRSSADHESAALLLAEGETRAAWRHHVRSVLGRDGWRFLPFTTRWIGLGTRNGSTTR